MKRIRFILCLIFMINVVFVYAAQNNGIEPKVTKEEAIILQKVADLSKDNIDSALKTLLPHINESSSSALFFALGTIYFSKQAYSDAEIAYTKALKKFPDFNRARANLARVFLQQEKTDQALKELQTLLSFGNAKPSTLALLGYAFLLKDEPVPAESAYRHSLLTNPEDLNAYSGLAKALLAQERYKEAIDLLNSILEKKPFSSELWLVLAQTYLVIEDTQKAILSLECARRLEVIAFDGLASLGDLYINSDQPEQALKVYKQAFSMENPRIDRMLRAVKGFILISKIKEAEALINKISKIRKDNQIKFTVKQKAMFLGLDAEIAKINGLTNEAIKKYKKLIKQFPLNGKAMIALGNIYNEQDLFENALIFFERASRLNKYETDSLIQIAQVYVKQQKYRKAVNILETVQMKEPKPHIEKYITQLRYLSKTE